MRRVRGGCEPVDKPLLVEVEMDSEGILKEDSDSKAKSVEYGLVSRGNTIVGTRTTHRKFLRFKGRLSASDHLPIDISGGVVVETVVRPDRIYMRKHVGRNKQGRRSGILDIST